MALMLGSSMVPSTCEWLASICSIKVDPARGRPTTKIASGAGYPKPLRSAMNCEVKSALERLTSALLSLGLYPTFANLSALPNS